MTARPNDDNGPAGAAPPLRVGVVGARGTMGQRLVAVLAEAQPGARRGCRLAATLHRTPPPSAAGGPGAQAAGVLATSDAQAFAAAIDVAVDFSAPAAAASLAPVLAAAKVPYVVASTGLAADALAALEAAGARAPVLVAANTSLGIHVLLAAVRQAAAMLPHADVEVVEIHHRRKRDAPSGTALVLGEAAEAGRCAANPQGHLRPVYGRGPADPPRQVGDLGYSTVRGGDVVGEHTVLFLLDGERVELGHRCTNPTTFARGALVAALWLVRQKPGQYTMGHVLAAGG